MNEKQRKAAIIVASILGCGALFYLGGLLGQVFTNYTIWMESGGMWGQTQIAAPDWNPAVCLLNAFSWNGVKAIFLIVVIGAGIVIYVKVHEKFSQNQYDDRGFTKSKAGTYGTADWMTEKELKLNRDDPDDIRVAASVKQVAANPVDKALEKIEVNSNYAGTVTLTDSTGIFVRLDMGAECRCRFPYRARPPKGARVVVKIAGVDMEQKTVWGSTSVICSQ